MERELAVEEVRLCSLTEVSCDEEVHDIDCDVNSSDVEEARLTDADVDVVAIGVAVGAGKMDDVELSIDVSKEVSPIVRFVAVESDVLGERMERCERDRMLDVVADAMLLSEGDMDRAVIETSGERSL